MSTTELTTIKDESRQLDQMNSRLADSLFSKDLAPHYMKLAGQLAASEIVPKCYRNKPSDLFLCWAKGYQLGIPPEQAMDCITVINGKAVMWGDEMLALCMSHPDFDDIVETPIIKNDAIIGYCCTVKRKGKADKENVFTLDMAKKAGLLAKGGVWNQYPDRMLKLRARGFCLRDAFPDALKGIKSREEIEDYSNTDYKVVERSGSRTELLKNDLMINQGGIHVETINGLCAPTANSSIIEENPNNEEPEPMDESGEQAPQLHLEIKRLIEETGFTEERLAKALAYYEVDTIDALNDESSIHFIQQLQKL